MSELRGTETPKTKKDRLKEAKEFLKEAGVSDVDDIRTSKDFMLMTLGLNIAAGQSGDFLTNVAGGAKETLGTFGELKAKEKDAERAVNLAAAEMAKADYDAATARGAKLDETELAMLTEQYKASLGSDDMKDARVIQAETGGSLVDALKQVQAMKGSKSASASSLIVQKILGRYPDANPIFVAALRSTNGLKYIGENFDQTAIAQALGLPINHPDVAMIMGIAQNPPEDGLGIQDDPPANSDGQSGDGITIEPITGELGGKMPDYKVTLPDGRSFKVTAPEGTSMDQIRAKIKAQFGGTGATPEASVEDESEGTLQEIGEGIVGGVIEAGSGLLETAALVPDLATGSDYAVRVSEAKNKLKDDLGIDPTGAAGEITEALVQFVVPGLGAAGLIGKAAKLRNFSKASKTASQVVGAGVTDAIVASDGTTTIGDFFEGGPTMSSENVGETGREEAARRIGNKFKIGLEAAGATAAAGPVFKALGIAGQGAVKGTRAVSDVTGFSTLAGRTGETISASTQKIIDKYPVADQLLGLFRSRGMLPQQAFEEKAGLVGKVESQLNKTGIIVANLQNKLDKIFGTNNASFRNIMIDGDSNTQVEAMNLLYGFLTKDKGFVEAAAAEARRLGQNFDANSATDLAKFLPDFMKSDAIKMRSQIDLLSRSISRSDFVQGGMIPDVENIITNNLQNYMRRKFAAFEDPNWFRSDNEAFTTAYENAVKFYRESPEIAEDLYTKLVGPIPENFTVGVGVNRRMTDASAREMMDAFVKRYEKPSKPVAQDGTVTRSVKDRLRTSLLTKEKLNEPALRAVLGEVKDPMEAFVSTVNDLAEFRAVDSYYQYLAKNFLDQGDEFISQGAFDNLSLAKKNEYRKLDSGGGDQDLAFGALQGSYVKKPIYNNLTNLTLAQGTALTNATRLTYGNFLRGKGLVQFAKTVLSPITQVRNVTTASLFAAAQGNIGRGANLGESIGLVVDNIYKGEIPRLAKAMGISNDQARGVYFRKLQELGVVGTQAQVREIDRLLEEGFGGSLKAELDELGVSVGRDKGVIRRTLGRSKLGQFLDSAVIKPGQRITKGARDAYQGGDDIWKIYNFEFERNKLISALGSETDALKYATEMGFRSVDEYAADIVKNVVPNYERVPEAIKLLRRAPLGNFIAFPAEIIRTSANTLRYAVKELQSSNSKVRDIGMRRLMGFTATTAVAAPAAQGLGMYLGGVAQEQMDALQRRVAPWSRNSTLIPTSVKKGKDGKNYVTGYVDYSYLNPYDYWQRPARAILNAVNKGEIDKLDADKVVLDAGLGDHRRDDKTFSYRGIHPSRTYSGHSRYGAA